MRAIVAPEYGGTEVLRLEDVAKPEHEADQVLVRVKASSMNPYDWHLMTGLPRIARPTLGWRRPKRPIIGADFAGIIEEVGADVEGWFPGDEVYGQKSAEAFAEYAVVPERYVVAKPKNLSFEEAAAVPLAGTTALQAIRDQLGVEPGHRVLVNGASGGVGHFAVQIAANAGADVTGVCSTRNVEMVRSLGASRVIDYTREDLREESEGFDRIFDLIGNHPVRVWRRLLADDGAYLAGHGQPEKRWLGPIGWLIRLKLFALLTRSNMKFFTATQEPDDWRILADMLEAEELRVVLDDKRFTLDQVPDAMRYLQTWHARGKVAIKV